MLHNCARQMVEGPEWLSFGVQSKTLVAKKIEMYKEQVIKYRRHYNQNLQEPVIVDTYALFPVTWLWPGWTIGELGDYQEPWNNVQKMLIKEFPRHALTFSSHPEREFTIPGVTGSSKHVFDQFWVKIKAVELLQNDDIDNKILGTLIGYAVGDALGARYVFSTACAAKKAVKRDTIHGRVGILGGGPYGLLPGQVTKNTELAVGNVLGKKREESGSLTMIPPIALINVHGDSVYEKYYPYKVYSYSIRDSCRVYYHAIRQAIHGSSRDVIWTSALEKADTEVVKKIIQDSKHSVGNNALQLAFYELLYTESFENSLIRTVTRGGDTNTNGCIVGALLGAFYGHSEIPEGWVDTIQNANNPNLKELALSVMRT